jgi:tagaturonate reductase
MLNATSKFRIRLQPSILEYAKRKGALPKALTFSFATLAAYYNVQRHSGESGDVYRGAYKASGGGEIFYEVRDDARVLEFFESAWAPCRIDYALDKLLTFAKRVLSNTELWDLDLSALDGFPQAAAKHLHDIMHKGIAASLSEVLNGD